MKLLSMLSAKPKKLNMVPVTITKKKLKQKKAKWDALRISCIVFGIFIFVAIGLIATLSIIGMMKTITVWDLLREDIAEQMGVIDKKHSAANIEKLKLSLDQETVFSSICIIFTGFSTQLTFACIILLYGLFTVNPQALLAWIIYSGTNIIYMILFVVFVERCSNFDFLTRRINIWFEGFMLCLIAYNIMLIKYTRSIDKKLTLVVKSNGGYSHTVKPAPSAEITEKPENYIV
ncbi:PREDICTED: uncharacterized protein LOC108561100 [Nicrophorus vespilloides]|uniref:Uncharacterized protein LOC108561100 n=1 Tax=Nicrophorus vespilloides TaxID=110193 RepID=A0ABM1MII9_NICVS|nr:PREDICTED: uncharacterized protein LOC108561100 [Nicrophorus vespilloides]